MTPSGYYSEVGEISISTSDGNFFSRTQGEQVFLDSDINENPLVWLEPDDNDYIYREFFSESASGSFSSDVISDLLVVFSFPLVMSEGRELRGKPFEISVEIDDIERNIQLSIEENAKIDHEICRSLTDRMIGGDDIHAASSLFAGIAFRIGGSNPYYDPTAYRSSSTHFSAESGWLSIEGLNSSEVLPSSRSLAFFSIPGNIQEIRIADRPFEVVSGRSWIGFGDFRIHQSPSDTFVIQGHSKFLYVDGEPFIITKWAWWSWETRSFIISIFVAAFVLMRGLIKHFIVEWNSNPVLDFK